MEVSDESSSIYKIARSIKRRERSLYNALRSIYVDAGFVEEIRGLRPGLPLVANLRCGLWYARRFDDTCYFKSTDGHTGNWSFNPARLNFHIATTAARYGGCLIVDSTRKGKRFPDSMSKTIPIWTCVLNRGVATLLDPDKRRNWDCLLHLPSWVSDTEKSSIQDRLDQWVNVLIAAGADLESLAASLEKPLRPLWISQRSLIWLDEIPELSSLDFTPIILVSASRPEESNERCSDSETGWSYIPGAADDEESWARGLTPEVFWSNAYEIIDAGPDECDAKVAALVTRAGKRPRGRDELSNTNTGIQWIGNTGLAVGAVSEQQQEQVVSTKNVSVIDCLGTFDASCVREGSCLRLHIEDCKLDHYSLQSNLSSIIDFSRKNLGEGRRVLILCKDGENVSVSVAVAVLIACTNGAISSNEKVTKWDVRQMLVYVSKYVPHARTSRGNLRQVYNYLIAS